MLTITKPNGDVYHIADNGNISYPGLEPSGDWKLLGIRSVRGGPMIPLSSITKEWLARNPLTYKNGNPCFTGVDLDHGTRREWGNTKYHGIKTINIGPKHVGTWVVVIVNGGEFTKYGIDGDTEFPYSPDDLDAIHKQALYQSKEADFNDTVYILHVFDNGQMKQFEFDPSLFEEGINV